MSNDTKPAAVVQHDLAATLQKRWDAAGRLECTMSVDLSTPGITIGNLLDLRPGSIVNSHHPRSTPVPVRVNGVTVGHGEFEAVGDHLAVRITEIL